MVAILFASRIINKENEPEIYGRTKHIKEIIELYINYGEHAIIIKSKEIVVNDRPSNVNIKFEPQLV